MELSAGLRVRNKGKLGEGNGERLVPLAYLRQRKAAALDFRAKCHQARENPGLT